MFSSVQSRNIREKCQGIIPTNASLEIVGSAPPNFPNFDVPGNRAPTLGRGNPENKPTMFTLPPTNIAPVGGYLGRWMSSCRDRVPVRCHVSGGEAPSRGRLFSGTGFNVGVRLLIGHTSPSPS